VKKKILETWNYEDGSKVQHLSAKYHEVETWWEKIVGLTMRGIRWMGLAGPAPAGQNKERGEV